MRVCAVILASLVSCTACSRSVEPGTPAPITVQTPAQPAQVATPPLGRPHHRDRSRPLDEAKWHMDYAKGLVNKRLQGDRDVLHHRNVPTE